MVWIWWQAHTNQAYSHTQPHSTCFSTEHLVCALADLGVYRAHFLSLKGFSQITTRHKRPCFLFLFFTVCLYYFTTGYAYYGMSVWWLLRGFAAPVHIWGDLARSHCSKDTSWCRHHRCHLGVFSCSACPRLWRPGRARAAITRSVKNIWVLSLSLFLSLSTFCSLSQTIMHTNNNAHTHTHTTLQRGTSPEPIQSSGRVFWQPWPTQSNAALLEFAWVTSALPVPLPNPPNQLSPPSPSLQSWGGGNTFQLLMLLSLSRFFRVLVLLWVYFLVCNCISTWVQIKLSNLLDLLWKSQFFA